MKAKRNLVTVVDEKNQRHVINLDTICFVRSARTGDAIYVHFVNAECIGLQGKEAKLLLEAFQA